MITAVSWVPRGYAAQFPTKYVFDDDEYERIAKLAKLELDDAKEDLDEAKAAAKEAEAGGGSGEGAKEDPDSDMSVNHPLRLCTATDQFPVISTTMI